MQFSSGFQKSLALYGYQAALSGGKLQARTGLMPAKDAAVAGTLLAEYTNAGGAWTGEVRPIWKITLAGASGSVDTITIGTIPVLPAAVNFITDLATTALAIATSINNARSMPDFEATTLSDVLYIIGPRTAGAAYNSAVCATTVTTMTATVAGAGTPAGSGGTAGAAAVNGLNWLYPPVAGILSKETAVWEDLTPAATGATGYFRYILDAADDGSASTVFSRVDFTAGTSGADINGVSLGVTIDIPSYINSFPFTIPAGGTPT